MELSSLIVSNNQNKYLVVVFIGLVFIFNAALITSANEGSHIYTIHLGTTQHDDPNLVTDSHHDILGTLLGSKEASRESMIYSYRHGFSGFAASLTPSQARELSEHPDVVHITKSKSMKLMTTRVSEYLGGLSPSAPSGLSHDTDMGSNAIIGVIDTGIWPDSPSFSDKGLGPIPKRWKGRCVAGEQFNVSSCNRKLIGANYYLEALQKKHSGNFSFVEKNEVKSPLDKQGHGTHCASTAGGSFAPNASFVGQAQGTARGLAPKARIASYKACWNGDECNAPDVIKAIDDAIRDRVDVISMSLGGSSVNSFEIDPMDYSIATFHAVMKGIPVVTAAGNEGPNSETVSNIAPWTITVAATTMDRELFTPITLGNNITLLGREGLYTGPGIGFTEILYFNDLSMEDLYANKTKGKILFSFKALDGTEDFVDYAKSKGAAGVIMAQQPTDRVLMGTGDIPFAYVDNEIGMDIVVYIQTTKSPVAKIGPTKTFVGRPSATKVALFSSRGPNNVSPAILKPDIAAPGAPILAAYPRGDGYRLLQGTSMSTPVISGIVALLRQKRPKWSPAAIKSALVTTALQTDPYGEPIASEGSSRKLADPFDFGGGLVNPAKVADPGLVYDMGYKDYAFYLCSAGYDNISISKLLGKNHTCSSPIPSMLDFNMPSLTIPYLSQQELTITRTVTNVGPVNSIYKPVIEAPQGINVKVIPETLQFSKKTKKITYKIKVSTTHRGNTDYLFGSLTWTSNAGHNVRIPLSIRTRIMNFTI